jgi:hypothetical protein
MKNFIMVNIKDLRNKPILFRTIPILILLLFSSCQIGSNIGSFSTLESNKSAPTLESIGNQGLNFPKKTKDEGISIAIPRSPSNPTLSLNKQWIAYSSCNIIENTDRVKTCKYNVWVSPVSDPDWRALFSNEDELGESLELHFSPDSKHLAVINSTSIWFFNTDSWDESIKIDKLEILKYSVWSPWSPDSQTIAVQIFSGDYILSLLQTDGSILPLLTFDDVFPIGFPHYPNNVYYNWGPTWSPDGEKLAFLKYFDNYRELWEIDISTGNKEMLCHVDFGDSPSWSPDGQKIVLLSNEIRIFDFMTHQLSTLEGKAGPYNINGPIIWSPNGQLLAAYLDYGGSFINGIYLVDVNSGNFTQLEIGFFTPYVWTSDNNILIENYLDESLELYPVQIDNR